ncbi:MAG: polysaccharide deacetylase family protein [Candidatus Krumholzibacteriia bacterium]
MAPVLALLLAAAAAAVPEHAVVLMYHHVDDATPASTSTPPAVFAAHLELLETEGCVVLPLAEVVAGLRDPAVALPDRAVALTFDDGYASVFGEAFPRLRARGWPFTVFVSPAEIDAGRGPVCTWDELRAMAAAGATVASHGLRHEHLQRRRPGEDAAAWRARVAADLRTAARRLAEEMGAAPPLLAYPYGEWSPELADLVADLGWTGFGQHSGPAGAGSDPRCLPRFPAAGPYADPAGLAPKLRTLPLPVRAVAPVDPRVVPGTPRPALRLVLDPAPAVGTWRQLAAFDAGRPVAVTWPDGPGGPAVIPAGAPLAAGRARTNVTAPSAWPGRWYWYSHLWIAGEEHTD